MRSACICFLGLCLSTGLFAAQSTQTSSAGQGSGALDISSGEKLLIELETSLHTRTTKPKDRVAFRTIEDVRVGDRVAIPRGSLVQGTVIRSKRAGRLAGRAEIHLRLDQVRLLDGTELRLPASIVRVGLNPKGQSKNGDFKVQGDSGSGGNVGSIIHGGTQGAVIGVMTGSVQGAMWGAAAGAGIGLAQVLLQRGPDVDLPRSTLFEARFDNLVAVPAEAARRSTEIARATAPPPPPGGFRVPDTEAAPAPRIPDNEPEPAERPRPRLSRTDAPPLPEQPVETVRIEPPPEGTAPPVETVRIEPPPEGTAAPVSSTPGAGPEPTSNPTPASIPGSASTPTTAGEAEGAFKLSVNVHLVQVDALVRDPLGRPLDNLKKGDFRIFEDGTEQQVQTFSRDELPVAVALVIDRSGSVAPYIDEIRRAAYRALMQLKRGDQVCLFTFAGEVDRLEDLTTDRQRIADRIATIRAGGGTNIVDAIHNAVSYLGLVATTSRRAVILISDNQGTTQPRASESQTIRLAMESETVVYSVKTGGDGVPLTMRLPNLMSGVGSVRKMAEETGGEIIDVATTGSLDAALGTAVSRLKLRYTLGYNPENTTPGTFRRIEVRLADHFGKPPTSYRVHSRNGYYYPTPRTADRTQR